MRTPAFTQRTFVPMSVTRRTFCMQAGLAAAIRAARANGLPAGPRRNETANISQAIRDALRVWRVPGTAVAIVREGGVECLQGIGLRGTGDKKPVTEDTLFPLASCSKSFLTAS